MLRLEFPNISHKEQYLEMIEEWKGFEDVSHASPGALFRGGSFEEFLQLTQDDVTKGNRHGVPATLFFMLNESDRILGAIQLRHHIDHPNLIEVGGHIGYGVRPSERQKGYATEMLGLVLYEAREIGIDRVLLTCFDDNVSSWKVIEKNGGVFERYTEKDGKRTRRYWIALYKKEKEDIKNLEIELLQYETRQNTERLNELLADDFFECGASGDQFGKKECLNSLPLEPREKTFEYSDMEVYILSHELAQVRWKAKITNPGKEPKHSFRTSLWRKTEKGWQMFFHQGTLIV